MSRVSILVVVPTVLSLFLSCAPPEPEALARAASRAGAPATEEKLDPSRAARKLAKEGRALTREQWQEILKTLEKDPEDTEARTLLLGFYFYKGERVLGPERAVRDRREHVLWMIGHQPGAPILGDSIAAIEPRYHSLADPEGYQSARALWLEQVERHAHDPAVLSNAARFLQLHDKGLATDLLERGRGLEPDEPRWPAQLGYVYALAILGVDGLTSNGLPSSHDPKEAEGDFARRARAAVEETSDPIVAGTAGKILFQYGAMLRGYPKREEAFALAESLLKRAQELEPDSPRWSGLSAQLEGVRGMAAAAPARPASPAPPSDEEKRFYSLDRAARQELEAGNTESAAAHAEELLEMASRYRGTWNYGNAIHHGNLVLGRVALAKGDLEGAKGHLIRAGKTPGSPQLNSFGPSMTLARDLLAHGERETVLEYLDLCDRFWSGGKDQLQNWSAAIRDGGTPDFKGNIK